MGYITQSKNFQEPKRDVIEIYFLVALFIIFFLTVLFTYLAIPDIKLNINGESMNYVPYANLHFKWKRI